MRLTFFGAAGEVTGSTYLLETDRARILVDFGLHQGEPEADEHNEFPDAIDPARLDAVVLTHAHLDHCGRLPMLAQRGYRGVVHATPATIRLADIILQDAAALQAADAERAQRHAPPGGGGARVPRPLYSPEDVRSVIRLFRGLDYGHEAAIAPGIAVRFFDAGHILGSASALLTVREHGTTTTIAFSGDIGPRGIPIIRDPAPPPTADVMILESTYGDRDHRSREATLEELHAILDGCAAQTGKVLIPAFAIGRTQDLIYEIGRMCRTGACRRVPIYLDSPMGIEATQAYRASVSLFDAEAREMLDQGHNPLHFPMLRITRTAEESRRLNDTPGPLVVIAGSGMCTGGRILHHLRHNLPSPTTQVLIVGYQGEGTLGRRLVDHAPEVRIHGQTVPVRARIHTLGGFSAHAGQSQLIDWARALNPSPTRAILTHGEPKARDALHARLKREIGLDAARPVLGETIEL
ncbi:MAG: MBL fold metallo-hydrolase [Phycisphaerae bacterium]|nr:MBL fold metallo-hydrolase [Phycisphaerae bacterium]